MYRIVYKDGYVGTSRPWRSMLEQLWNARFYTAAQRAAHVERVA